jgi:hypothetical protein
MMTSVSSLFQAHHRRDTFIVVLTAQGKLFTLSSWSAFVAGRVDPHAAMRFEVPCSHFEAHRAGCLFCWSTFVLSLSLTHTHTHTHTGSLVHEGAWGLSRGERERRGQHLPTNAGTCCVDNPVRVAYPHTHAHTHSLSLSHSLSCSLSLMCPQTAQGPASSHAGNRRETLRRDAQGPCDDSI